MKLFNLNTIKRVASFKNLQKSAVFSQQNTDKGSEINCISGRLWVTQKADGRDFFLKAGDQFKSRMKGLIVVQALEDSRLKVNELRQVELSVGKTPQLQTGLVSA